MGAYREGGGGEGDEGEEFGALWAKRFDVWGSGFTQAYFIFDERVIHFDDTQLETCVSIGDAEPPIT